MTKIITALLTMRSDADIALARLEEVGFSADQVSLLMSEQVRNRHFTLVEETKSDEGALTGATIGGLAGALYLGLASAGAFLIPGLNLIVSGALIGALAGLGAGGAVGGLVGALVGSGIPEHEAKVYEKQVRDGGILIAVQAENDEEEEIVKDILKDANAQSIKALAA
jgi:hypothetical protein